MDDVVHTGVDQLLLLVLQVLCHIVWHKYNAALTVHYKQKAVQGLKQQGQKKGELVNANNTSFLTEKCFKSATYE